MSPLVTRSSPTKCRGMVAKRKLRKEEEFHRADTTQSFADLTSLSLWRLTTFADIVTMQDEQQVKLYNLHPVFSVTYHSVFVFTQDLPIFMDNETKLKQSELYSLAAELNKDKTGIIKTALRRIHLLCQKHY